MKLYQSAVKKPITTALIFIGIMIIGMLFYTQLPVDIFPKIETNSLTILTPYQGAGAEDIETNVTRPLEDMLNSTENLKKIQSVSKDNISLITLEFNYGTNIDNSMNDVRDKLGMAKRLLPKGADDPLIFKFSADMIPVVIISVMADESQNALYKILDEKVVNPLNRIPGVGTVSVSGAPRREIQVNIVPERIDAYGITVEQIAAKIAEENLNVPGGNFDVGSQTYMLRLEGQFKESAEINNIIVSNFNGNPVYLRDVAQVSDTIRARVQEGYTDGKRSAMVIVQKQSGANTVDIAQKIDKALPDLQKTLPPDVKIQKVMDTAEFIVAAVNSLKETILMALIIVALVVLFFLGRWRATFIILLTIPISLISSFIYLFLTGNTINIISLSALSITIGLVVDDAIVVLENITTHIERGSRPDQGAVYATEEVSLSVIASTLTIIAVFLPMTMIGGFAGMIFSQLGWMVTIIITLSTIAALSLTPMLSSKWLRAQRDVGRTSRFDKWYDKHIRPILDKLDHHYSRLVNHSARHRWRTVAIVSAVMIASLVAVVLGLKTEFMPATDNDYIEMRVHLPTGTRMELSRDLGERIRGMLEEKYNEIDVITVIVGQADEDNTFASLSDNGSHIISFHIGLVPAKDRHKSIYEIGEEIRTLFATMPEIHRYEVMPGGDNNGGASTSGSNLSVDIFGYDFATTDRISHELHEKLSNIKGLKDVKISRQDYRQEYQIEFDREKLALQGLTMNAAASAVRNRMNGMRISQFREQGEEYDITVRFGEEYRSSVADIENITLFTPTGKTVKIRDVGRVVEKTSLPQIDRQNRERVVRVQAALYGRALSEVVKDINKAISSTEIPSEIGVKISGSYEDQQESFRDMTLLLLLVTLLVYIVIASQFESLTYPFIIILTVPIAFIGGLLFLVITGYPMGIMGFVGVIMLVGIIVKNGIVLIDYINLNRERGMSIITAVVDGGKSRLRPVLMTTLTTILGMIPMAIGTGQGAELWKTLGITVIGGMTFATIITLILVPALYSIFGGFGVRRKRKIHRQKLYIINGNGLKNEHHLKK